MTIRQKNILSFAIFFSAIFLNATMAKIQLNILKQTDKIHHIAHTLKTTLSECRKHEKNILLFGPYKRATLLGIVEKTYLAKFNDNLDVLEKAAKQGAKISKKKEFSDLSIAIENYKNTFENSINAWPENKKNSKRSLKLYENARKKAHKIESITHKIMRATELKITDAHANLNNIFWLMVTILILGGAVICFYSRKILSSIYELTLVTNHIANGDLNQKLTIKSNDELGKLAVTFNKMAENLRTFSLKEKNLLMMAEKATKSEIQKAKELEQVQARLFQSSKLATLGEMSTGIAHEINQPLAGIALIVKNTSMLLAKNKLSVSNIKKDIKDIESMIQRISKIIYHIRVFAGQESMDFTNVNIHNTLEASLNLLREQLRQHNIKIIFNFSLNLPEIIGEPYQLEQVWINLIINARDAIETKKTKMSKDGSEFKGQINIKTKLRELKAKQFVEINVSDNGTGLNETQREKAFEPFFTSKEVGQGIGLGLPISYGIIKKHKGTIELKNQQAEGTSITVLLPIGEI